MSQIHELRAGPDTASAPTQLDAPSVRDFVVRGAGIVKKHRWMVLLAMAVVMVAGIAINAVQPRLYTASSRIVIHPRAPRVLDKVQEVQDQTLSRGWGGLEQFYNTQQDIITGKAVARTVVESKGLAHDERWVGDLSDPATGEAYTDAELTRRAISQLRRATELAPSPKSQIFEIKVTDEDPSLAASLANSLALSYRDYVLAMRVELTATTSSWLTTQVDAQRPVASSVGLRSGWNVWAVDSSPAAVLTSRFFRPGDGGILALHWLLDGARIDTVILEPACIASSEWSEPAGASTIGGRGRLVLPSLSSGSITCTTSMFRRPVWRRTVSVLGRGG